MGESEKQPIQLSFDRFLRVVFQGSRVTSNCGLILVRELDERLGFGKLIDRCLTDARAKNARFSFADLLRQSVYSRLAGYEVVNDAERLSHDPTFRIIGSDHRSPIGVAATSKNFARRFCPSKTTTADTGSSKGKAFDHPGWPSRISCSQSRHVINLPQLFKQFGEELLSHSGYTEQRW
jgi:DDE family transposase